MSEPTAPQPVKLSVVIPVYNECDGWCELLSRVQRQQRPTGEAACDLDDVLLRVASIDT